MDNAQLYHYDALEMRVTVTKVEAAKKTKNHDGFANVRFTPHTHTLWTVETFTPPSSILRVHAGTGINSTAVHHSLTEDASIAFEWIYAPHRRAYTHGESKMTRLMSLHSHFDSSMA